MNNELPNINYSILSGPSFAHEVAGNMPAALVLASNNIKNAIDLSNFSSGAYFITITYKGGNTSNHKVNKI